MRSSILKRSILGVAGLTLALGLTACGSAPFGGHGGMGDGPMAGMMGGHGHRGGPRSEADMQKMRERMVERVTAQLELDAAQKAKFTTLLDTMHAKRAAMMGAAGGAGAGKAGEHGRGGHGGPGMLPREQMQELIKGDRFDRARAQALVDEKTAAARTAAPDVIAAMGDFYDSLKPEQQAKVRTFMERGPGRGMMGGHRHG